MNTGGWCLRPTYYLQVRNNGEDSTVTLEETSEEKDLGVLIDNQLKFSKHTQSIVADANKILGLMKRSFEELNKDILLLYRGLIRGKLEFCVQAWSPYMEKDQLSLEGVQRRATKMVRLRLCLKNFSRPSFCSKRQLQKASS